MGRKVDFLKENKKIGLIIGSVVVAAIIIALIVIFTGGDSNSTLSTILNTYTSMTPSTSSTTYAPFASTTYAPYASTTTTSMIPTTTTMIPTTTTMIPTTTSMNPMTTTTMGAPTPNIVYTYTRAYDNCQCPAGYEHVKKGVGGKYGWACGKNCPSEKWSPNYDSKYLCVSPNCGCICQKPKPNTIYIPRS